MFKSDKKSIGLLLIYSLLLPLTLVFMMPLEVSAASVEKLQSFDMQQISITDLYLVNADLKKRIDLIIDFPVEDDIKAVILMLMVQLMRLILPSLKNSCWVISRNCLNKNGGRYEKNM